MVSLRLTHPTGLILAAVAILCASSGCHRQPASVPSIPGVTATVVRASPCELFTGDLKRLEPHLRLTTGCLKLDFASDVFIGEMVEVWEDGKQSIVQPNTSERRLEGPGELTISLKEETDHEGVRFYRMVTATSGKSSGGSDTRRLEMPETDKEGSVISFSTAKLDGAVELSEGKPVAVWAYLAQVQQPNTSYSAPEGPIEQQAKRATWAVVVKVYWKKVGTPSPVRE